MWFQLLANTAVLMFCFSPVTLFWFAAVFFLLAVRRFHAPVYWSLQAVLFFVVPLCLFALLSARQFNTFADSKKKKTSSCSYLLLLDDE